MSFLNLTKTCKTPHDLYRFMLSVVDKPNALTYLWITARPHNKELFEYFLPLMNTFNERQKGLFLKKGAILVNKKELCCSYMYGKQEEHIKTIVFKVETETN